MLHPSQTKRLIEALQNNEIVIMPTDTIYGLSAKNSSANQLKINQLKKAPPNKPLITLISNWEQLERLVDKNLAADFSDFLHQGITLIFPLLNTSNQTTALRLVTQAQLAHIIDQVGPLWSTSVNFFATPPLEKVAEMETNFPQIKIFPSTHPLKKKPSRIYNTLTRKWLR